MRCVVALLCFVPACVLDADVAGKACDVSHPCEPRFACVADRCVVPVGGVDAGSATDAGPSDAGPTDAGTTDAGTTSDAGPTDAGPTDGGDATLIAAYDFDVLTDAGVIRDVSGNGHDLVVTGGFLAPGVAASGLLLDTDVHAQADSLSAAVIGESSFSVSLCFDAISNLGTFDIPFFLGGSSLGHPGVDLELGTQSWDWSMDDGTRGVAEDVGDETLAGTGFHCFAISIDKGAGVVDTFVDGALVATDQTIGSLAGADVLQLGGADGSDFAHGVIDELRLFARPLGDVEVGALHDRFVEPGLLARFSFDDISDGVAADVSGNGHDAVVGAGVAGVAGFVLGGAAYDGQADARVDVTGFTAADFAASSFTVHVCNEPDASDTPPQTLFRAGACDGAAPGVCITYDGVSTLGMTLADGAGRNGIVAATLADKSFHCATFVADRDAQALTEFVDGAAQSQDVFGGVLGSLGAGALVLGSDDGSSPPVGVLDEVRVYARALSSSEVARLPHP